MFECEVPAEGRVPAPHSHDAFEETIYGLEGVAMFAVDGETLEIGAGDSVCIPRGTIHGFENTSGARMRFLAVATPGVFGPAYFQELSEILARAGNRPPERAAMLEVMHRHGLTPAPPPGR